MTKIITELIAALLVAYFFNSHCSLCVEITPVDEESSLSSRLMSRTATNCLDIVDSLTPKSNIVMSTILSSAEVLARWTGNKYQEGNSFSKSAQSRFRDAKDIVKNLNSRLIAGATISHEDKQQLKEAMQKMEEIEIELNQSNELKFLDFCRMMAPKVREMLKKIPANTDPSDMDSITQQVDIVADLITINMDPNNPFKQFVKALLMSLVNMRLPRVRQITNWVGRARARIAS